jgi:hypothetical protein
MFHTKGPILRVFGIIPGIVTIVHGDILRLVALMLGVNMLLVMVKDTGGLCLIAVNEIFFPIY